MAAMESSHGGDEEVDNGDGHGGVVGVAGGLGSGRGSGGDDYGDAMFSEFRCVECDIPFFSSPAHSRVNHSNIALGITSDNAAADGSSSSSSSDSAVVLQNLTAEVYEYEV
jgi:hypothetical protein